MDNKSSGKSKSTDFELLNKLGQGSFGIVYKIKRKETGKIYVLKQIDTSKMSSVQRKEAVHEATILSSIDSPYIVKYYDSYTEKHIINIVMEYCENGDLGIYLKKQMGRQLSEQKIWKFFIEMCLGMQYLHANKILHRDIKTINMFLTKEDKVKIGDLGVAKMLNQTANFAHTIVGTPYYLSPELCEEKPYNHKSDIWSLGCVLYELCTLKHPFESNNQGALILKIVRGKYNPIPSQYSKDLSAMVDKCLCKDYKKRPSIQEILDQVIMSEKAVYFGYTIPNQIEVKNQPRAVQQTQPLQQQAVQQLKPNIQPANNKPQFIQQSSQPPQNAKEKQYYQQLLNHKNKQQLAVIKEEKPQQNLKPLNSERAINNIPSSYMDPYYKKNIISNGNQQVKNQVKNQGGDLNNNKFDVQQHEKKIQSNNNVGVVQQKRPSSNHIGQRQYLPQQPIIQQQQPVRYQPAINAIKQIEKIPNQIQQASQQQVLGSQQVKNQRVKTVNNIPQQLSRKAQQAQKMGQKILKQGDSEQKPQIMKPNVNLLKQITPPESSGIVTPISKISQEAKEVMNLPDDINKSKKSNAPKTNQELMEEYKQKQKKEALEKLNKKIETQSQMSATELHDMKLIVPRQEKEYNSSTKSNNTVRKEEEEKLIPVQRAINDDEFDELINESESNMIQPSWSLNQDRETVFVPTYNDQEEEIDLMVYKNQEGSPQKQSNKMKTIKEERGEDCMSEGSDTAYFNGEEEDFNNRDDEEDNEYNDEEERERQLRYDQLNNEELDNEDNQPYDAYDDNEIDQEEEEKRYREEFGEDEEDSDLSTDIEKMNMTTFEKKLINLNRDIKEMKRKQEDLQRRIPKKRQEGYEIAGQAHFEECYDFFCSKAKKEELSEKDMIDIAEFVYSKNIIQRNEEMTAILFQLYMMEEEFENCEREKQSLSHELIELDKNS